MLIGLSSLRPQVGKSTVANALKREHGFLHAEMSDPIVVLAERFFGYDNELKGDPAQRRILQELGLMGKTIDPTIWLYHTIGLARRKKWGLAIESMISPTFLYYYALQNIKEEIANVGVDDFLEGADLVIGGVRSPDEADEISKIGGKVFLITMPEKENQTAEQHAVENALDGYTNFTGFVNNNGTIEDLERKVSLIASGQVDTII
jgi:hypothetical protein